MRFASQDPPIRLSSSIAIVGVDARPELRSLAAVCAPACSSPLADAALALRDACLAHCCRCDAREEAEGRCRVWPHDGHASNGFRHSRHLRWIQARQQLIFDTSRSPRASAGIPRDSKGLSGRGSAARLFSSSAIVGVHTIVGVTAVCGPAFSSPRAAPRDDAARALRDVCLAPCCRCDAREEARDRCRVREHHGHTSNGVRHSRHQHVFDICRSPRASAGMPRVSKGLSRRVSDARHFSSSAIVGVNAGPELRSLTAVCGAAFASPCVDAARAVDSGGEHVAEILHECRGHDLYARARR